MAVDIQNIWPDWHVVRVIGKGSCGTVYEAEKDGPSGKVRAAVKVISVPADDARTASLMANGMTGEEVREHYRDLVDGFIGEIMVEESLKGAGNIVSIDEYRAVPKSESLGWDIYIRMELLTSLSELMASGLFDENRIIDLGIDISSALVHYEKMNTVHGDIKPENIFVDSAGTFKLADFSSDKLLGGGKEELSVKDAFSFNAPESQLEGEYIPASDTYSLGLLLYVLANGNRMPFAGADQTDVPAMISAAARRFNGEILPPPANASADFAQLTAIACDPDPNERFASAAAMRNALRTLKKERANNSAASRVKLVTPPGAAQAAAVRQTAPRTASAAASTAHVAASTASAAAAEAPRQERAQTPAPASRNSTAKAVVPIIIATIVTAIIVAAAILFIPKLFNKQSAPAKAEEAAAGTAVAEDGQQSAAAVPETTAQAAAESSVTEAETRKYQIGDIITFGNYEQDNNAANGKEQIEWIVLDVQADRLLLISRYGLDGQQYDTSGNKNVSWQNCTLRGWLHGTFYNEAFSSEEQDKIVESLVRADKNSQYPDRDAGVDTVDKVFLLSTSEVERYFVSDVARKLDITEYAKTRGVTYCDNKDNQGYGYWWWLRTPGRDEDYAALVFPEGKVDHVGYHYNDTENAVRPAMWIKP